MKNETSGSNILIGCRIPRDFFITKGKGESDIAVHAGSYHLALKEADIEMCNIMTYSSILPGVARQTDKPKGLVHGSVMETIMATATCEKGESCTAGIIFGWLYDRKTDERYGGLVCEHNGNFSEDVCNDRLKMSLNELYINGFDEKYELRDIELFTNSIKPKKKFGTALVALCFTTYIYPVLQDE